MFFELWRYYKCQLSVLWNHKLTLRCSNIMCFGTKRFDWEVLDKWHCFDRMSVRESFIMKLYSHCTTVRLYLLFILCYCNTGHTGIWALVNLGKEKVTSSGLQSITEVKFFSFFTFSYNLNRKKNVCCMFNNKPCTTHLILFLLDVLKQHGNIFGLYQKKVIRLLRYFR